MSELPMDFASRWAQLEEEDGRRPVRVLHVARAGNRWTVVVEVDGESWVLAHRSDMREAADDVWRWSERARKKIIGRMRRGQ